MHVKKTEMTKRVLRNQWRNDCKKKRLRCESVHQLRVHKQELLQLLGED